MPALVPHKIVINSKDYYIKLPDFYDDGDNSNIGSAMSITKLTADDEIGADEDTIQVGDSIKTGKLLRLRLTYKDSENGNVSRSAQVICPVDKAKSAITAVLTKKYRGGNITAAGVPRRRRLG